jgi:hypothetical protein
VTLANEDTPWSKAGFDITGKYEGGHSEKDCLGPAHPSSLDLNAGHSPLLQLIAQELGQEVPSLRKQFSDELRLEFKGNKENLVALYGKAKMKDADTYVQAIQSKDWILAHPEIDCLARISNLEIVVQPEEYESATGCKIMYTYNPSATRGNITIFRSVEGSVAKISSAIKEEAEVNHTIVIVAR